MHTPLSVASNGTIIESSTEYCGLNKCNLLILSKSPIFVGSFRESLIWIDDENLCPSQVTMVAVPAIMVALYAKQRWLSAIDARRFADR
jgi:hypothetical protein